MGIFSEINIQESISVIVRTIVIFFYAFILLRILGRRRLSHLTYIDILLIISYGSAVGDAMIYGESTVQFWSSIIAITVVAILVKILDEFTSHSLRAQNLIEGHARLLIDNGTIIIDALNKESMSKEKLMSLLRERGFNTTSSIKKAFIESDGELSVVSKQHQSNDK